MTPDEQGTPTLDTNMPIPENIDDALTLRQGLKELRKWAGIKNVKSLPRDPRTNRPTMNSTRLNDIENLKRQGDDSIRDFVEYCLNVKRVTPEDAIVSLVRRWVAAWHRVRDANESPTEDPTTTDKSDVVPSESHPTTGPENVRASSRRTWLRPPRWHTYH